MPLATPTSPARLVLVDDHPVLLRGLSALLEEESDLHVVAQATSPEEGIRAVEREQPDLVITDLVMRSGGGITFIKDVKSRWPALPVVVLTQFDALVRAVHALHAGALGYVIKDEAALSIVAAVRHALDGRLFLSSSISERLLSRTLHAQPDRRLEIDARLSARELEVFEAIGKGLDTEEIGERLHLSPKTVASFRRRIKDKLGVQKLPALIRMAVLWVEAETRVEDGRCAAPPESQ